MGCDQCNHTGIAAASGLYEVMRVTDKLRRMIAQRASEDALREAALAGGMISLGEDGLAKVKSGQTTAEELLRVVTEVREMRALCPGCSAAVGVDFLACPQLRPAAERRLPELRPVAAARLELLPVLRAHHRIEEGQQADQRARSASELPAANVAEFKKQG